MYISYSNSVVFQWFQEGEIGLWWSVMVTGTNVACSLGPLVAHFLTSLSSWRLAFQVFGAYLAWLSVSQSSAWLKPLCKEQSLTLNTKAVSVCLSVISH